MNVALHQGDCREVAPILVASGVQVDAIVTDPPYDLTAMAKRFGKPSSTPAQHGRDGAMARLSGGFMGLGWDSTGVAFDQETWRVLATILRPGGFLLAFGGTRTAHRMVSAIEDAGFVIQDTIAWMYGSGFPKRRDMLKPAFEPICVAYRPGGPRTLQVNECRVASADETTRSNHGGGNTENWRYGRQAWVTGSHLGRWPANVIHDGSDEVMEAFAAFGESASSDRIRRNGEFKSVAKGHELPHDTFGHSDRGTPSRFFYCAKAGKRDRWGSLHPTVKPVELIRHLVKLVCPVGGTILDPFAGSGIAGIAALAESRNAILIEQDETYCADIRERLAYYEGEGRHSLSSKARHAPQEQAGTLL